MFDLKRLGLTRPADQRCDVRPSAFCRQLQSNNRCPEEGGIDDDNLDRDVAQEIGKASLGAEGAKERPVLQLRQHAGRQASGQVDAARCQNRQRQVAGFGSPDIYNDTQRLSRERVVIGVLQRRVDDQGRTVYRSLQGSDEGGAFRRRIAGADVVVNVLHADTGGNLS